MKKNTHGSGFVGKGSSQAHVWWGTSSVVSSCGCSLGNCTLHLGLEKSILHSHSEEEPPGDTPPVGYSAPSLDPSFPLYPWCLRFRETQTCQEKLVCGERELGA